MLPAVFFSRLILHAQRIITKAPSVLFATCGLDADNDDNLSANEINQTQYVCQQQSCLRTDNDDGTTTVTQVCV